MHRIILIAAILLISACTSSDTSPTASSTSDPLQLVNQQIEADPTNRILRANRGSLYYEQGDYKMAILDLREVTSADSPLEWWHLLADAYLDDNQSLLALETLQKAASQNPHSIATLLKLSEFQLITRQHQDGLNSIQKVHDLSPNHAEGSFMKGLLHKDMGDTIAAKTAFHDATREDPALIDAWIELGALYSVESPTEAIRYYDAALRQDSAHIATMHAKAVAQNLAGHAQDALATYRTLLRHAPHYADGYFNMGLIYLELDSLSQALDHFDLTTKTAPQYVNAYFYRGVVHELAGNLTSARLDYQIVVKFDPEHDRAQQGIHRVTPPDQ